jgi:hypothetical protein
MCLVILRAIRSKITGNTFTTRPVGVPLFYPSSLHSPAENIPASVGPLLGRQPRPSVKSAFLRQIGFFGQVLLFGALA